MPQEVPAYIYINAYINIVNCQAHDGTLTIKGTGSPAGKEDYTLDYNGKHYDYTQTLNIQDSWSTRIISAVKLCDPCFNLACSQIL